MNLVFSKFRVRNFRNIDDSGWIPVESVTALVGRNESGKTALLKALHKFNPATEEPYNPQREFPRDRFTYEFKRDGGEFPVCEVEFLLSDKLRQHLRDMMKDAEPPSKVTCTRYYDGMLSFGYDVPIPEDAVPLIELIEALDTLAESARRITAPSPAEEEATQAVRGKIANWAAQKKDAAKTLSGLKTEQGSQLLKQVRAEANGHATPATADAISTLVKAIEGLIERAEAPALTDRVNDEIIKALPVFIYFENYGILDSAVYLPHLLNDVKQNPHNPRVRTINAMFKHVNLTADEIAKLGQEESEQARREKREVTADIIARDQQKVELRAIKLNSASSSITTSFNEWYGQRRHKISYQADGDYFRIWISDNKRPQIEIELESRSKGFQWFFSFYLVFLVESQDGHRDAILLLDEPGLHLHPTAQQELIAFFDRLAQDNPLIYTTHSPFLIDGNHIHRVRPVKEDDTGHSQVSIDTWPQDRETIFPLQAAAGYAMVRGLFQHKKNVLVEGTADYLYLHCFNQHCRALGRTALPDDIYITPCGGTKNVGYIASLFLGQQVRPIILLDGDQAGRERHTALLRELYMGHDKAVLILSDVLGQKDCQIEDFIGEEALLTALKDFLGKRISLNQEDRMAGGIINQIKTAAKRHKIDLPEGWKPDLARRLVVSWSTTPPENMPQDILDRAESLFRVINERFGDSQP